MPKMVVRNQCPNCTNLKLSTDRYCEQCNKIFNTSRWKVRNDAVKAQYGFNPYTSRQYQVIRKEAIERGRGLCIECFKKGIIKPFKEVDHIKNIAQGGGFFDIDNLQLLCTECHKIKTSKEARKC